MSAFHQVISIDVRSNLLEGEGVFGYEGCRAHERKRREDEGEIEYCKVLNANLPSHIQVIAWAPCGNRELSARFDCTGREYKYFFPRAGLDLGAMRDAAQRLVGSHDFRNFCKLDVNNGVLTYVRRVISISVEPLSKESSSSPSSPYDICVMTLAGNAFLWHQVGTVVSFSLM